VIQKILECKELRMQRQEKGQAHQREQELKERLRRNIISGKKTKIELKNHSKEKGKTREKEHSENRENRDTEKHTLHSDIMTFARTSNNHNTSLTRSVRWRNRCAIFIIPCYYLEAYRKKTEQEILRTAS